MAKIVILTMCPGGGCPRMAVMGADAFFRDDYDGEINLSTRLLKKLSALK